jgi:hypothetical protein
LLNSAVKVTRTVTINLSHSIYFEKENSKELLLNKIKCEQVKQHKSSNYDTAVGMKAETFSGVGKKLRGSSNRSIARISLKLRLSFLAHIEAG